MKNILNILLLVAFALSFTACDDDYNGIQNQGNVKILSFTSNGTKMETLDEEAGVIELVFPAGTDLTKITPSFTLSEGAKVLSPENPNGPIDLSKVVTYTIVNGNLYHDYKVVASHVNGQVLSFDIGRYKGVIDHTNRTIIVRYPIGEDVTSLTPLFTLTSGAELISPTGATQDFTNPVEYVVKYLDETFTYTVTVELTNISLVGFLGHASSAAELTNMDEKTAYEWMTRNFAEYEYISFDDIKGGKNLSGFGVIWYHYDSYDRGGDPEIHADAENPIVVEVLKEFRSQGGGLFLSSAGLTLGNVLDVAKNNQMWNNAWGFDNAPFELNDGNGFGWGMRITNDHEIFTGLRMPVGESEVFYTISNGCKVTGHNVIWNFSDDWTGWNRDVRRWENETGGKQLATFHWDDNKNERCILAEYEREDGVGAVITCGSEVYDWYQEDNSPENQYRDNIEKLTLNILNYLAN